jgi:hypothetical protein
MDGLSWESAALLIGAMGTWKLGAFLLALYKLRKEKEHDKKLKSNNWHDYYKQMDQLYGGLRRIMHKTKASRVLIVQNQNGGGKPHLDSTIYSTVIHEEFGTDVLRSMKDNWHMQVLDRHYLSMLSEMDKTGEGVVLTKDLDKDSILFKLYFGKGIVGSRIFRLSDKHDKYTYLVANYLEPIDLGGPSDDVYRSVVNELRLLFNGE